MYFHEPFKKHQEFGLKYLKGRNPFCFLFKLRMLVTVDHSSFVLIPIWHLSCWNLFIHMPVRHIFKFQFPLCQAVGKSCSFLWPKLWTLFQTGKVAPVPCACTFNPKVKVFPQEWPLSLCLMSQENKLQIPLHYSTSLSLTLILILT